MLHQLSRFFPTLLLVNLFSSILLASDDGYAPAIKNTMNPEVYDWNAMDTRWINMRALGIVALDSSTFIQDDNSKTHLGDLSSESEINLRAIRVGAAGTINFERPWVYLISGSLNVLNRDYETGVDDKRTLLDLVVGIPLWGDNARMQVGKMKAPISMERNMGLIFEQTMERPMHLDALLSTRNIGISISDVILNSRMTYRVGIYNDWLEKDNVSFDRANKEYIGRVTTVAYKDTKRVLHFGIGYKYSDIDEKTLRITARPEEFYVDPWLDTGEFSAQSSDTYNFELTYMDGPLWLACESTITDINSKQSNDPNFYGYHMSANYLITGEHRGYNSRLGLVRRVTPILSESSRGVGAVEVSFRHSYLNLNDKDISGGEMQINSVGMIWHPRRDVQLHAQYSRADLNNNMLDPITSITQSKTNIIQARIVVLFD